MRKLVLLTVFISAAVMAGAQSLTLESCYQLARQNYPLIKQKELIINSRDFTIANAHTGYLPQLTVNGQATYQSDVTKIPIDVPGFPVKPLSKDQYKVYAEVSQNIYDGGVVRHTAGIQQTGAQMEDQRVEVELFKLNERINQLFFGVLLLNQQLTQNDLLRKDISSSLAKAEAGVQFGTAMKMNVQVLQAEALRVTQRDIEIRTSRRAYLDVLGLFIHQDLPDNQALETPVIQTVATVDIKRPELQLFQYQRELAGQQYALQATRNMPRVGLFFQGGYGRPGLNVLKNEFATYYIGGARLSWNLSGFYNSRRDRQLMEINTRQVDVQQDLFQFNTNVAIRQQSTEITKLDQLLRVDDEIIALRAQIKTTAKAQLENGVMSANDFIRELNAEDQAKQNKILHEVQLQLARANYRTTIGN